MVRMLNPQPNERVLDPACGTGGFLVAILDHLNKRFHKEAEIAIGDESTEEFFSIQERLRSFVSKNLFGADFDPFLIRATQMNTVMGQILQVLLVLKPIIL